MLALSKSLTAIVGAIAVVSFQQVSGAEVSQAGSDAKENARRLIRDAGLRPECYVLTQVVDDPKQSWFPENPHKPQAHFVAAPQECATRSSLRVFTRAWRRVEWLNAPTKFSEWQQIVLDAAYDAGRSRFADELPRGAFDFRIIEEADRILVSMWIRMPYTSRVLESGDVELALDYATQVVLGKPDLELQEVRSER